MEKFFPLRGFIAGLSGDALVFYIGIRLFPGAVYALFILRLLAMIAAFALAYGLHYRVTQGFGPRTKLFTRQVFSVIYCLCNALSLALFVLFCAKLPFISPMAAMLTTTLCGFLCAPFGFWWLTRKRLK